MEDFINWLRELITNKGFKMIEYYGEYIWYNSGYSTTIEIDSNDNLIIGRPIEEIYTTFKITDDISSVKDEINEEINFYMNYYINKHWKN